MSEFNAAINNRHLFECLTHLLTLYDERDVETTVEFASKGREEKPKSSSKDHRQQMEAMYILLNIGNVEALRRALNLPLYLKYDIALSLAYTNLLLDYHRYVFRRRSTDVRLSTEISLAWYVKNYVRVCSLIRRLSPILICAAMINIQSIRR